MLYKKIIKKGVKDITFIQKFLAEKLENEAIIIVNVNDNVLNKILIRYGRTFKVINSNRSESDFLIYNDEKYSFYVNLQGLNGKYGYYYKLTIIDNPKQAEKGYNNKLENYNKKLNRNKDKDTIINSEIYELYKELFKFDFIEMFNPFTSVNFTEDSTINKLKIDKDEEREEIIDKIEELEERYNLD